LGLSICDKIVKSTLERWPSKVKLEKEASSPFFCLLSKERRPMNKSPVRVLVVDDDPVTLNLLSEVLSKEGYRVDTALGGEEAIAKGMEQLFDVVITDVKMGDKDGMEVLRSFRKNAPDTTVIMITAFGSIETAHRGDPRRGL